MDLVVNFNDQSGPSCQVQGPKTRSSLKNDVNNLNLTKKKQINLNFKI